MTEIIVSRQARHDFKRIWHYIACDNDAAADSLLMAIDAKIERLRRFPEMGSPRDHIRPGMRLLVHRSYLVLYEYDQTTDIIEIVAIVEGGRDLERLF